MPASIIAQLPALITSSRARSGLPLVNNPAWRPKFLHDLTESAACAVNARSSCARYRLPQFRGRNGDRFCRELDWAGLVMDRVVEDASIDQVRQRFVFEAGWRALANSFACAFDRRLRDACESLTRAHAIKEGLGN